MAIILSDCAAATFNWLKTASAATALRALIQDGALNVLEAGDLREEHIDEAYAARGSVPSSMVLGLTVHDAGERVTPEGDLTQTVTLRVIDRANGYRAIRGVRDALRSLLDEDLTLTLVDVGAQGQGVLTLQYSGRSGYRIATDFNVEYEALTFLGRVQQEDI